MLKKFIRIIGGDPNKREIESYTDTINQVNALEAQYEAFSEDELRSKTEEFRQRLGNGETLEELLPEAFAAVREASKRTIGLRHYDVQLVGGITLHNGKIAEMRTGEGKTLVATLPLYLNALTGKGVHLVTVNDYLARRDARWMAPIYDLLGMSVGVLQIAARTENGKKAFIVELERTSPHEDQHQLRMVMRREAYAADIIYGTNSEFGFDYLRDNMTMRLEDRVQRGHHYAIIDEVDNVLIDEARTPLIISGPAQDEAEWYIRFGQVVKSLRPEDYEVSEKDRSVTLTEIGESHVEELLGMPLRDPERPEDVTLEQARMLGYLEQALRAQYLFRRNKDYLIQGGKVIIVDEFTGRLMPGRRWSDGLHQAVEAKEGVRVQSESVTYATITIQNYFRMYEKLAGMSGTAITESEEFDKIYKLGVLAIPTNLEFQASLDDSPLVETEGRDEGGYKFNFYTQKDDPQREPVFWRRKDFPDVVYRTEEAKLRAIAREILRYHVMGRPILVGTTSVELSERVAGRLRAELLRRLTQTMLLREVWMTSNNRQEDGRQIPELQYLYEPLDKLEIGDMRKMARELGISFNPEDSDNLDTILSLLELKPEHKERLHAVLQAGIPHQVLNARKHTEESQIIAGAGAYGAVTIATNMAGRGVDIKLGGELAEEILAAVNRILSRAGFQNPYDMSMQERRQALLTINKEAYGIYETEIQYFLKYLEEMELVRALGGLHVIGSERHEARRIDNQLRGRSARQGDPGSSRFYLSMEDELMRLFGGQQADGLMQRMRFDDALPLEVGLVSRLVEQAQTRVEGANFDVRKHLLEYDDVLNTQRASIYSQRNRIFIKEDLKDDVTEMLRVEVSRRIPLSLEDEEGPWKLLAWLDQVQPPLVSGIQVFPSYTYRLLVDHLRSRLTNNVDKEAFRAALIDLVKDSLSAEKHHQLRAISSLLETTMDRLESQLEERLEIVDTFFEGLSLEEEGETRRPADILAELSTNVHLPLKLAPDSVHNLIDDPESVVDEIKNQITSVLNTQAIIRVLGAVERRLDELLDINPAQITVGGWDLLFEQITQAVESTFEKRFERYLGPDGQIIKDLENTIARIPYPIVNENLLNQAILQALVLIPQGSRASFDKRTHRRVVQRTTRLSFTFFAAHLLEGREPTEIADDVIHHLESAQDVTCRAWGLAEFNRLSGTTLGEFDAPSRQAILNALGESENSPLLTRTLQNLSPDQQSTIIDELGRRTLTALYRQLLLGVITELWVEYLTQMEALRISIGLEAYAQRDPLVQYKNRAFELYENLLSNMRLGVVSRMFTYRPRDISSVQTGLNREEAQELEVITEATSDAQTSNHERKPEPVEASPTMTSSSGVAQSSNGKKRRRRRR